MKAVFVSPMFDYLRTAAVEIRSDGSLSDSLEFHNYMPPGGHMLPYVPAYFQDYNEQRKPFKAFLRSDILKGMLRHVDFWIALPDDTTDLEAHALSELMVASGAKLVTMEYRAYLLSNEPAYLAVTASKRAVSLTHVVAGQEETERVYLPINEAEPLAVRAAINELDATGRLPVFTYDLPDSLAHIGEQVNSQTLALNFLHIL